MKKVLILVNHDVVIYNFRLELVERLLGENYYVYISSPYGERIENLKELGCRFIETPISRHGTSIKEDFNLILKYREMMKWVRPDIVLTFTIKPNIYGGMAASSLDIPFIANITGLGTAVENGGIMQKVTIQLYRIAFRKVKCVFFQNEENQQFFIDRNIAMGKHQLIPGSGVNLERFPLLEYPKDDIIRFVFISRIMKEKGIDQYLKAAKNIKQKYPNTEFHICGFCEEDYEEILNEYENKGIIIYHGMVWNIVGVLKNMHCTVHPTYYPEGMSNVLLESAACGRPLITTNRSGCKEIVDDGLNGYVTQQKHSEDLIEKIIHFLNLPNFDKRSMGISGRRKVEKEFDRKLVVDSYLDVIKSSIKNRGSYDGEKKIYTK